MRADLPDHSEDTTFEGLDLGGERLVGATFEDCVFEGCSFEGARVVDCRFVGSRFVTCNLSLMVVDGSHFGEVAFTGCRIAGVNWATAAWSKFSVGTPTRFERCDLSYASFMGVRFINLVLKDCRAIEVDFSDADLSRADFSGTDLARSHFRNTNLTGAHFETAYNYAIDLRTNRVDGARFSMPEALSLLLGTGVVLVDPLAEPPG